MCSDFWVTQNQVHRKFIPHESWYSFFDTNFMGYQFWTCWIFNFLTLYFSEFVKQEKAQPSQTIPQPKIIPGQDTIVPVRGYTRTMVKTMSEALKIPHFGYNDEVGFWSENQIMLDLFSIFELKNGFWFIFISKIDFFLFLIFISSFRLM